MELGEFLRQQVALYCFCVFDALDIVEVRHLPCGRSQWYLARELAEDPDVLWAFHECGQCPYVGVNPRKAVGGKAAHDVALARCLFVDFDDTRVEDALAKCQGSGLPLPTLALSSGHGCHAYWRLQEQVRELGDWIGMQSDLIALLGSDPMVRDAPRVMRLPGFRNLKREPAVWCHILDGAPDRRYEWQTLRAITPERPQCHPQRVVIAPESQASPRRRFNLRQQSLASRVHGYLAKIPGAIAGQRGHNRTFAVACKLVLGFDFTPAEAMPFMSQWNRKCSPPWSETELLHKLHDADNQSSERGYLLRQAPTEAHVATQKLRRRSRAKAIRTVVLEAKK